MFERTVVPRDFDVIEVPYRERGEPQLVRWKDCASAAASRAERPEPSRADAAERPERRRAPLLHSPRRFL